MQPKLHVMLCYTIFAIAFNIMAYLLQGPGAGVVLARTGIILGLSFLAALVLNHVRTVDRDSLGNAVIDGNAQFATIFATVVLCVLAAIAAAGHVAHTAGAKAYFPVYAYWTVAILGSVVLSFLPKRAWTPYTLDNSWQKTV